MGYLQNSNTLVKNSMNELDKILQSGSSISITGLGEPVLVTWINVNDRKSTATSGLESVDELLGENSPFRYNRVENLPVYGVTKEIQSLEMQLDDFDIADMNWEIEPVIPPNTVIPNTYDYMIYKFDSGRSVVFRVNNVQISTARSNGFYKVPMHLVDIDSSEYETKIEKQVVDELIVDLDRVGTNERCIIKTSTFGEIKSLEKIIIQTMSDYVDTFFDRKYNSFIFRGFNDGKFIIYDPYLTKFIINHDLLNYYSEILQPIVIEQRETFRADYNKTVFRALEMRDLNRIKPLLYEVATFDQKRTNPFYYWGEEVVYQIKTYEDKDVRYPKNNYMDFNWLYNMRTVEESPVVSMIENTIIRYFKKNDFEKFLSETDIEELRKVIQEPEYSETFFYLVPIVLYILTQYMNHLINSYS
mgnify:CR=1 FL=1